MDNLWKQVLEEVEVEVSKPIYQTFFLQTSLESLDDLVAIISTSSHVTADYIEKRYYSLLKKIIDKKTGKNLSLVFTTNTSQKKKQEVPQGPLFVKDLNTQRKSRPARIRADYTFESLAVSETNQLAYTAALAVASNPGSRYNPLFIYGSVGVGKTHLMNAIANKAFNEDSDFKVLYLTTEEFTNEVVEAIKNKSTSDLRKKFRNVDLLILDDVQFLTGKEKVQEELFHTFNALVDKGKQIALSSDRPPHEIKKLEARLMSRFEGGLIVDIEPPNVELRTAILLIKGEKYGINLTHDAAMAIAEKVENTRALEGFLLKLTSTGATEQQEVGVGAVSGLLGKTKSVPTVLHPDTIVDAVCAFYNIKNTQLKGVKRDAFLVRARHLCMFLLKTEAGLTYVEVGNLLGGRDHTTVMHAVEKIGELASNSDKTKEEILFIKQKIRETYLQ